MMEVSLPSLSHILVLAHGDLRVDLLDEFKRHGDHNQKRRAADGERADTCHALHDQGEDSHSAEEDRPHEREPRNDVPEIERGRLAGTDPGDEGARLLQVF